jgi:hypothetical protein
MGPGYRIDVSQFWDIEDWRCESLISFIDCFTTSSFRIK